MNAGLWRIARVAGVDVLIGPSLLVMGALLVLVFAPRYSSNGAMSGYVAATLFVLGIYVSVFLHECAHMIAARGFGLRVRSITLHLFGGFTAIESSSRTAVQEFVVAVVGPLVSVALGVGCLYFDYGHPVVASLAWFNIVVGLFNLLPGLPLDGGRALRAVIWKVTGRGDAGTRLAAWAGRMIAIALVAVALLRADFSSSSWSVDVAFAGFVAWFIWEGASAALAGARRGVA